MLCVRYVLHALCSMRSMRDQARNEAAPWRQISTGEAQEEKDDDDKYDGRRKSRRNRSRMGLQAAAPCPRTAAPPVAFKRVLIAGHEYTTLSWFCGGGGKRPSFQKRQAAYEACKHSAYVLVDGDTSTLEKAGFATATGKELWPGATYLVEGPKDTCCHAVAAGSIVQLKRPTARDMAKKSRPVLLKVEDLRSHFS